MKLIPPKNPNYAATIVKIKIITPLAGCDNIVATPLFGYQAIVSKDTQVGDIGVFFPAETELSEDFCRYNNLYRHADKNKDTAATGYLEDTRRIRAVKLRKHVSNCLFMPLSCLVYAGLERSLNYGFHEGDVFDAINDKEICKKYELPVRPMPGQVWQMRKSRVDRIHMPEHFDTENYWKNKETIPLGSQLILTQKLHGTSIRIGHTLVKRKLNLIEQILVKVGIKVQPMEYSYVFGSRKVIKDANNPDHIHFYDEDIWAKVGKRLEGMLPKNYIVYGEVIGWTSSGAAIQSGYTYNLLQGTCDLYVYRIAMVNEDGFVTDLSWDQIKEFCTKNGLNHVPEIGVVQAGGDGATIIDALMNKRFSDLYGKSVLPLSDKGTVDEGLCIRLEGLTPRIYKAKAPQFLEYETKMLDKEVVSIEETQV